MRSRIGPGHPLRKLFSGLVEQVFMTEIGICNTRMTGYVSDLLSDFVHMDRIYRLHTVDGETIRDLSRAEADAYLGPNVDERARTRLINHYIGDFTLFWTGVYPEVLSERIGGVNRLQQYLLQGKRSYGIASELSDRDSDPPGALLRQLSEEFESCVHGLQLVRENWQQLDSDQLSN